MFTASVPGGDTNTVTFYNGGTPLGTAAPSGGMATLTTSGLPTGNDSITAQIAAGGNYTSATSSAILQAVNAASPGIAVATSGTPSYHGLSVTFTATVTGGCTGTVTFYDGGTGIGTGTVNGSTATLATGSLAAGTHSITASLPANGLCSTMTSNPINQAVNPLYDAGTVTLTVSNSGGAVFTSSASYSQASTPESVAEALAGSDSNVNVTAVNDALYIEATGTGTGSDYSYAVSSCSNYAPSNPPCPASYSIFASPSFQGVPPSGSLTGGAGSGGGQTPVYSYTVGYDVVGNVTGASDINTSGGSVMGTWTYAYDTLNRLVSGHNTATTPASIQYANMYGCWAYDDFGNRTANDPLWTTACPAQESSLTPTDTYNTNNQMDVGTKSYDPSGNMTEDSATGNTYLYDGEGRVCAVSSTPVLGFTTMTGYVYDAEGTRVAKGTITSMSCDPSVNGIATANNETDYILGPGGEQVTELAQDANGTMNWQRTYVYGAGGLIGTYDPNPDTPSQPLLSFRLTDWLGTMRATTDAYGVAQGTCTGLPYGDGVTCSGDIPDNHHFTGKERDAESGNDYFGARYYASSMGRFMSPDPLPWIHWQNGNRDEQQKFAAYIANPQNLNLYAYVNNNPLKKTDPTGMNACGTNNDATCNVTITIKDRTKDANGSYNDQFAGLKGQAGYNATATVTVNGKDVGTFLAKTTPDDSSKSGTIQSGVYSATLTSHNGQYSAILLGTVPTIGPNPRQGGADLATYIEMHKSGLNGTAVASDPSHPISTGCQTIYRDQYSDFQRVTGLEPTAGSQQSHFTVDVDTQANQLNVAQ